MDRKEAIEYAKFRLKCHTKGDGEYTDYGEFLVAAIKALQEQDHRCDNCSNGENAEGKNVFEIIEEQPQVGGWIPVTYHIPTREDGDEVLYAYILDCPMPEEGQEILVSFNGIVDMDVCCYDEGWYLDNRGDWTDVDAWMPLPEPYKESEEE